VLTPRKLCLWNSNKQTSISDLAFPSSVLAVQMNRKRCGRARGAAPARPASASPVQAVPGRSCAR